MVFVTSEPSEPGQNHQTPVEERERDSVSEETQREREDREREALLEQALDGIRVSYSMCTEREREAIHSKYGLFEHGTEVEREGGEREREGEVRPDIRALLESVLEGCKLNAERERLKREIRAQQQRQERYDALREERHRVIEESQRLKRVADKLRGTDLLFASADDIYNIISRTIRALRRENLEAQEDLDFLHMFIEGDGRSLRCLVIGEEIEIESLAPLVVLLVG
ncbi:hypothetical protein KIPB_000400 [Kipferlia bialata]|uniref:Uncharacterized protein n=1 Tax=Kipferlia bialata TaxID=797122 RepID=A0A9K3CP35_9EUKA|nr:hypothetical protein KIPB_000400 [Kipferlia bialata]|eukprot:g400.t1